MDQTVPVSKGALWTGRIISTLVALFLLMDAVMKFIKPSFVVEGTIKFGYTEKVIVPLGIALFVGTLLYMIPRTNVLGAIILTGYLGGAVDAHVRNWEGWFPVFFAAFFGALVWLGLVLRDPRIRAILPIRT